MAIELDTKYDYWKFTSDAHIEKYYYDIKFNNKTVKNLYKKYKEGDKEINNKYNIDDIKTKKNDLIIKLKKDIINDKNFTNFSFRLLDNDDDEQDYEKIYFEYLLYTIFEKYSVKHFFKGDEYNKLLYNIVNKSFYENSMYDHDQKIIDDNKYIVTKEYNFVVSNDFKYDDKNLLPTKLYKGYLYKKSKSDNNKELNINNKNVLQNLNKYIEDEEKKKKRR